MFLMSADHLQNHCEKNCGVSCGIPQWFMMVLYQISLYMLAFIEFVDAMEKRHFHNATESNRPTVLLGLLLEAHGSVYLGLTEDTNHQVQ